MAKSKAPRLQIWTAQYRYDGLDRLDITAKGQDPVGKQFAPTWDMVMGYKEGSITKEDYEARYKTLLVLDRLPTPAGRLAWLELFRREGITLVCFCKAGEFCHRKILAEILVEVGEAEYHGERE